MTNLTPSATFDSVPRLETTTPVQGGASGTSNAALQALTNRTEYLNALFNSSLYAGTWAFSTIYATNRIVAHGTGFYISIANSNQGNTPSAYPSSFWLALALQGAPGSTGATGNPGANGANGLPGGAGILVTNDFTFAANTSAQSIALTVLGLFPTSRSFNAILSSQSLPGGISGVVARNSGGAYTFAANVAPAAALSIYGGIDIIVITDAAFYGALPNLASTSDDAKGDALIQTHLAGNDSYGVPVAYAPGTSIPSTSRLKASGGSNAIPNFYTFTVYNPLHLEKERRMPNPFDFGGEGIGLSFDDYSAFQRMAEWLFERKNGGAAYIPNAFWHLTRGVYLPAGVSVWGEPGGGHGGGLFDDGQHYPSDYRTAGGATVNVSTGPAYRVTGKNNPGYGGPVIICRPVDTMTSMLITDGVGCSISNLSFYYYDQAIDGSTVYAPTIVHGGGGGCSYENLYDANSYDFINCAQSGIGVRFRGIRSGGSGATIKGVLGEAIIEDVWYNRAYGYIGNSNTRRNVPVIDCSVTGGELLMSNVGVYAGFQSDAIRLNTQIGLTLNNIWVDGVLKGIVVNPIGATAAPFIVQINNVQAGAGCYDYGIEVNEPNVNNATGANPVVVELNNCALFTGLKLYGQFMATVSNSVVGGLGRSATGESFGASLGSPADTIAGALQVSFNNCRFNTVIGASRFQFTGGRVIAQISGMGGTQTGPVYTDERKIVSSVPVNGTFNVINLDKQRTVTVKVPAGSVTSGTPIICEVMAFSVDAYSGVGTQKFIHILDAAGINGAQQGTWRVRLLDNPPGASFSVLDGPYTPHSNISNGDKWYSITVDGSFKKYVYLHGDGYAVGTSLKLPTSSSTQWAYLIFEFVPIQTFTAVANQLIGTFTLTTS